jgi:2-dehydropantoate 2-reductase
VSSADPAELGPHDLVVITVKEYGLAEVAPKISALTGKGGQVVQITNGIPWWFFQGFGRDLKGTYLQCVDSDKRVSRYFDLDRHIGGVINCGVSWQADGSVSHDHSNHLALGRPDNSTTGLEQVAGVFRTAGYNTDVVETIQQAVMTKLLANISFNPVSALCGATLDRLIDNEHTRHLLLGLMNEGRSVTQAVGLDPGPDPAERFTGAAKMGASKTSMLQDVEAGKPLELDGILGAALEVAHLTGVPMPLSQAMLGLLQVKIHGSVT